MKSYIGFLIIILLQFVSKGQQIRPSLISSGTISPEAASIGKFGNIPVSYSTGIPSITIPIYEINVGKIKLPISLDYHSGGIKVDEISSSVGIGWALNCGGTISRNLAGLADEGNGGYLSQPDADAVNQNPANYWQYLYDVTNGVSESTPDFFNYNINGQSGKFLINKDNSIFQIPVTNNKIETYAVSNGISFKITDENGIIYFYDRSETYTFGSVNNYIIPAYNSVWHLSKIIDQNSIDTIFLNYQGGCGNTANDKIHNSTYTIGTQPVCTNGGNSSLVDVNSGSESYQNNWYTPFFVSSVAWRGGKIAFQYSCDRVDRTSEPRMNQMEIYANNNGSESLIKKIKLFHSYFFNNSTLSNINAYSNSDERNYRLRLDSVGFLPTTAPSQSAYYRITYNNTPMASRESYAQDVFGFNNSQWQNTTLLAKQLVPQGINCSGIIIPAYQYIGSANRDVNESSLIACSIQSIQYPTVGKSVFELEAHKYTTNTSSIISENKNCSASEGYTTNATSTFTMPSSCTNVRLNVFLSSYNYPEITNRPKATLTDQTTGQVIFKTTNMTPNENLSTGIVAVNLIAGHNYLINVNIYSTSPVATNQNRVRGNFDIFWERSTSTKEIKSGGGLRVKSITNYSNDGSFVSSETYKYGESESGIGILLTPYNYFSINSQDLTFRVGCTDYSSSNPTPQTMCVYKTGYKTTVYHSGSLNPVSHFSGSPVMYSTVTKYQQNASGKTDNGKTVYNYSISSDYQAIPGPDVFNNNFVLMPNTWRNGYLVSETIYKSDKNLGFIKKRCKNYIYTEDRIASKKVLKVTAIYSESGCNTHSSTSVYQDINTSVYSINTGINLLQSVVDTFYDDNSDKIVTTENYYYNNPTHLFPTKKQTTGSKGELITEELKYPIDFLTNGGIHSQLVNRHIISPVIENLKSVNGVQIKKYNTNYYDFFGDGKVLQPRTIEEQISNYPKSVRFIFNSYNRYGNLQEQQKSNDVKEVFLWGYNNTNIVARILGSDYNTVKQYIDQRILDNPIDDEQLRSELNKLRNALLGSPSLITTYTYKPLIGMTSQTDTNGKITYYDYDNVGRLKSIRDYNNKLLKVYEYKYSN